MNIFQNPHISYRIVNFFKLQDNLKLVVLRSVTLEITAEYVLDFKDTQDFKDFKDNKKGLEI